VTISLRNLPADIEKAILERSERDGLSLNKATAALLESAVRHPGRNSDFDEFLGLWSDAESREFEATLAGMRRVDEEDWKD
jgi:hypothetical protein